MSPDDRDYSFYSPRHDIHTRIDFILTSKSDADRVHSALIGVKTLSDHTWLSCIFSLDVQKPHDRFWNLDKSILFSAPSKTKITEAIQSYLSSNDTDECSDTIVWDALKVMLWGELISITASLRRTRDSTIKQMLHTIRDLELQHKRTGSKRVYQHLLKEQECLKCVETKKN